MDLGIISSNSIWTNQTHELALYDPKKETHFCWHIVLWLRFCSLSKRKWSLISTRAYTSSSILPLDRDRGSTLASLPFLSSLTRENTPWTKEHWKWIGFRVWDTRRAFSRVNERENTVSLKNFCGRFSININSVYISSYFKFP